MGMGLGIGLSKIIDIGSLTQMAPVFGVLTFINLYSTYVSSFLIEEYYLNNQRAKLLFDAFMTDKKVPAMKEINE